MHQSVHIRRTRTVECNTRQVVNLPGSKRRHDRTIRMTAETLEQAGILMDTQPTTAVVDKGFREMKIQGIRIWRSGLKRGVTGTLKVMIKRRSAIESGIGHMKTDATLNSRPLRGANGNALQAVLRGGGHNPRKTMARLRSPRTQSLRAALVDGNDNGACLHDKSECHPRLKLDYSGRTKWARNDQLFAERVNVKL